MSGICQYCNKRASARRTIALTSTWHTTVWSGYMHSFVALYLIACLDPTNHNTCVSLPVTDSSQAQPDGSEMSMMGCMGIEGANSAKKFWEDHPDMHKAYHFGGWSCQIGNKKAPDRGQA